MKIEESRIMMVVMMMEMMMHMNNDGKIMNMMR